MRHFKLKLFQRWFKKTKLNDRDLHNAILNLSESKSCVELGEGLYKVRIAYGNKGKSGGYLTIIAYKSNKRSVFLVGFAKNERANITKTELEDLKNLAKVLISFDNEEIETALLSGSILELEEEQDVNKN